MEKIITIKLSYTRCFLVKGNNGYIIIDTGLKEYYSHLINIIRKKKINFNEIKLIIVTHAHFDHCDNAEKLKRLCNAKVVAHKNAVELLKNGESTEVNPVDIRGEMFLHYKGKNLSYEPTNVDIVVDEELSLKPFGVDGKIIYTPGHTSDSISVFLNSKKAIIGDLIVGKIFMRGIPRKPVFAEDMVKVIESLDKLKQLGTKEYYIAHGGPFTVDG